MESVFTSQAMLMAAGLGTRLRPFTDVTTKALLPLLGIPVAQFTLDSLLSSGVQTIVANIHHDAARTRAGLLALESGQATLKISDESQGLLGSAGGIRKALTHFRGKSFFLANSDVLCDVDYKALSDCHQKLRARWGVHLTLAVFGAGPPGGSYREIIFDSQAGLITGIGALAEGRPFFVGAAILEPDALSHVPKDGPAEFVPTILEPAIRERRAGVFFSSGSWFDIGSPSLWLGTHLSILDHLESDYFPNQFALQWKKRFQEFNLRISERLWISRRSSHSPRAQGNFKWVAPGYWDGSQDGEFNPVPTPQILGPRAVLYGAIPGRHAFEQGIGYGGKWMSI